MEVRRIMLDTGLTEERKWGVPCYSVDGKNVVLIGSFNDYVAISFLKGALLQDTNGILLKAGPHSQVGRLIRITDIETLLELEPVILQFIREAAENERNGLTVETKAVPEPVPDELKSLFEADPTFEAAFHALTPGRQRGYLIHIGQAKNADTRMRRIQKHSDRIFEGLGIHDR
jgi:uncharacterized protein YdeI (YjbR/CyaY-like superfamily)